MKSPLPVLEPPPASYDPASEGRFRAALTDALRNLANYRPEDFSYVSEDAPAEDFHPEAGNGSYWLKKGDDPEIHIYADGAWHKISGGDTTPDHVHNTVFSPVDITVTNEKNLKRKLVLEPIGLNTEEENAELVFRLLGIGEPSYDDWTTWTNGESGTTESGIAWEAKYSTRYPGNRRSLIVTGDRAAIDRLIHIELGVMIGRSIRGSTRYTVPNAVAPQEMIVLLDRAPTDADAGVKGRLYVQVEDAE